MKNILLKIVSILVVIVLSLILCAIGPGIMMVILSPLTNSGNQVLSFISSYLSMAGIWIAFFVYCYVVKKNRKYFKYLGKEAKGNKLSTILKIGLPCGLGLNLICGFVALTQHSIELSFNEFNPLLILLLFVVIGIQSGAEELQARWFIYHKIEDIIPEHPLVPVFLSALIFSLLHITNPGMTSLAFFGLLLMSTVTAEIVYFYDSFWGAVVMHTGWNFCQNIILGLPNSGIVSAYSIFKLNTTTMTNGLAYNTLFGFEGSVLCCLGLLIEAIIIYVLGNKHKAKQSRE